MEQNFYNNFKSLLGYFVSHLEWVAAKNDSSKGFKIYVEPLLNSENFKRTGQGYSGDKIQNQISEWSHYAHGEICINIQANFGDYKTSKCYLNWKSTGLNIIAKWVDKKVVALDQEEYRYWEKPPTRLPINVAKSIDVLGLFEDEIDANSDLISFFKNFQNEIIRYKKLERDKKQMEHTNSYIKLLEYKKQIILQGPPGTGKTKLAKELALELLIPISISKSDIKSQLSIGLTINSADDYTQYTIVNIDENKVSVKLKNSDSVYNPNFKEIINAYEIKMWDGKQRGGNDPYAAAIGKFIYLLKSSLKNNTQFKIIQFHPSYTYEDFVRGIVADSKGEKIEYKNVNKILGAFAKEANDNFNLSEVNNVSAQQDLWIETNFEEFKEEVKIQLEQGQLNLSGNIGVFDVESECFKYGKEWGSPSRINFNDFKGLIKAVLNNQIDLKQTQIKKELSVHAYYRFTYYLALLRLFFNTHSFTIYSEKQNLKNYVLIIDEINRANLSSVLGELIYALEYRGEVVKGMYGIDENYDLILPPNLYMIGTMNTADRSVGYIDYAIRRRFAFVNVLPKKLNDADEMVFHSDLFKQVTELFIKNYDNYVLNDAILLENEREYLSEEFEAKDVWLGHSYFIQKKIKDTTTLEPENFNIRVKYEIVPILREYVKDGILNDKATAIINKIEKSYPVN